MVKYKDIKVSEKNHKAIHKIKFNENYKSVDEIISEMLKIRKIKTLKKLNIH